MFCVECGREVGDALSSTGTCYECFLAKNVFVRLPQYVDFEMCVHCRARKRGEIWIDPPQGGVRVDLIVREGALGALEIDRRVKELSTAIQVVAEDERNYAVEVEARGTAEGVPFVESASTRARIKNATCTRCSRMMGGYYESVVQVRAENRDLTKDELAAVRAVASRVIDKIVDEGDRNAFVLKDDEVHGGLDVYVATNNAGRQMGKAVSNEFGGRMREHPKIAGQKDGVDIWRVTFAIRLPEYRPGDVVVLHDEPLVVQSVTAKNVTLRHVESGRARTANRDDLERVVVLRREDAREAVVVTETDSEMQVLDPWSYATVTVLKPAGLEKAGASLLVLRWDGELIPLGAA